MSALYQVAGIKYQDFIIQTLDFETLDWEIFL